jgi:hypothetical protein
MQKSFQIGLGRARERAIVESLLKLEREPRSFQGLRFLYSPPGTIDLVKVEVQEPDGLGGTFKVQVVEGGEVYCGVEAAHLSIGGGRTPDEPLVKMMEKHGFDPEPYLRGEDYRTPPSKSRSVMGAPTCMSRSGSGILRGGLERGEGPGVREMAERRPSALGFGPVRAAAGGVDFNGRESGMGALERDNSGPFWTMGHGASGGRISAPVAQAAGRRVPGQMPRGFVMPPPEMARPPLYQRAYEQRPFVQPPAFQQVGSQQRGAAGPVEHSNFLGREQIPMQAEKGAGGILEYPQQYADYGEDFGPRFRAKRIRKGAIWVSGSGGKGIE